MKPYLFAFLLLLAGCTSGCEDEVDKTFDPTVMPEATTTGKGTFGFLYNGWVYSSGRFGKPTFKYDKEFKEMYVEAQVGNNQSISFCFATSETEETVDYIQSTFAGLEISNGKITITHFDKEKQIISGEFQGGQISKGRFDVQYTVGIFEGGLPMQTTTGEGTFGFMYKDRVYSTRWFGPSTFIYDKETKEMSVEAVVRTDKTISFKFTASTKDEMVDYTQASFAGLEMPDGTVTITRFDEEEQIISGRFQGALIWHGRFDMQYTLKKAEQN